MRKLLLASLVASAAVAQGPGAFPELVPTAIDGAPTLATPQLVMGATRPVEARLHGLASPAMYDHDGDGVRDLWIGEFETGACRVRVYKNVGSNEAPKFSDEFVFAKDRKGEELKIDSW